MMSLQSEGTMYRFRNNPILNTLLSFTFAFLDLFSVNAKAMPAKIGKDAIFAFIRFLAETMHRAVNLHVKALCWISEVSLVIAMALITRLDTVLRLPTKTFEPIYQLPFRRADLVWVLRPHAYGLTFATGVATLSRFANTLRAYAIRCVSAFRIATMGIISFLAWTSWHMGWFTANTAKQSWHGKYTSSPRGLSGSPTMPYLASIFACTRTKSTTLPLGAAASRWLFKNSSAFLTRFSCSHRDSSNTLYILSHSVA